MICQGRNKKSLKKIQLLGLYPSHIFIVLNNPKISNKLKKGFLILYEHFFIDVEPFIAFDLFKIDIFTESQYHLDMKSTVI